MRYATAVRRLRTIAEDCQRLASVFDGDDGPLAAYAFGPMLDAPGEDQDVLHLALVMGMPAAELPWGVEPPGCTSLASWLQLDKAPMLRRWRPHEWPVSNHEIRRPLPVWTRGDGVQTAALDALAKLDAEPYRLAEPDEAARARQTALELAVSSTHLRQVRDRYWDDRDWRRDHRGNGRYPEDHLWQAVDGYLDLLDASQALDASRRSA